MVPRVALVGLLLLAGPVLAAPDWTSVDGTLQAQGPSTLIGENGFTAEVRGITLEEGDGSSVDDRIDLRVPGATARYINVPTRQMRNPAGMAVADPAPPQPEELAQVAADAFAFDGRSDPATHVRILARGADLGIGLSGLGRFAAAPGSTLPPANLDQSFAGDGEVAGQSTRPDGPSGSISGFQASGLSWDEPFLAFFEGGVVEFGGQQWTTGRSLNASRTQVDPITGSGVVVYDNRMVLLSGRGADLAWPAGSNGWSLAAARLSGPFSGDVAWTDVAADLRAGGEPLPVDPKLLHIRGELEMQAAWGETGDWQVTGRAHFLAVDAGGNAVGTTAVAAAGLGLAALAARLLWGPGRIAAAFFVGHTGRLVKASALRSRARRRILQAIHEHQPVRIPELQQATGLSRTTVDYHLRVLSAHDLIQERSGTSGGTRNRAYMLNSGSLMFAVPGAPPLETAPPPIAGEALAVANGHPLRRSLYEAVRDLGPIGLTALNAQRQSAGQPTLPESSAKHHLRSLVSAGAISARRSGRETLYEAQLDDRAARAEQYRRLLAGSGALDLVRRARQGAVAPTASRERRLLGQLCELGLVEPVPGQRAYQVPVALHGLVDRL